MSQTKFLFCLFDGLRRDMVRADVMPNLSKFRSNWCDYPNSTSAFPSETRVQVSSFVTGAYPGGPIRNVSGNHGAGHGIMANVFYDPLLNFDSPMDTSDIERMNQAQKIYGRLQKGENIGEILANSGKKYSVLTTGKIGNARLLNLGATALRQDVFSIWGAEVSSSSVNFEKIIEKYGPVPEQTFPNNAVTQYATKILLDHFMVGETPDVQVIWYNEPDLSYHYKGIGSQESLSCLATIDKCFGDILDWWELEGQENGWHIIAASDHAQISTVGQVNVIEEFLNAGFHAGTALGNGVDVAVKRSYSGQVTVGDRNPKLIAEVLEFLESQSWCGLIFTREAGHGTLSMSDINVLNERSPDVNFVLRTNDGVNEYGYAGSCIADNPDIPYQGGVHGGLHPIEINNLLIVGGNKFCPKTVFDVPVSIVDILPTILCGLDISIPESVMGRPLMESFSNYERIPSWSQRILHADTKCYAQEVTIANVDGVQAPYLRGGKRII